MSEKAEDLYDVLKDKIQKTQEKGTLEKKFADFWRIACKGKFRVYDIQYKYEDSTKEFVEKHRDQLTQMRKNFVEHMEEYLEKCIKSLENNNFKVHYANTNKEAQNLFLEEIEGHNTIYKSKSTEAKDIGLLEVLKENQIIIKETDLGDVLVQLFDYQLPSYQLGPGVHFDEQEIVEKIKEKYDVDLKPSPEKIVNFFRETYRKELLNDVRVSLTSANAISADDGSIVLVENEGNISLLTRATDKHIVVVGITKIVPTIFDALLVAKVQERINNAEISYINFITSPSNTSDIKGQSVQGMYGAKEVVVILVNDWRLKAKNEDLLYKNFLHCISCKSCNFICPASRAFGNVFASKYGLGATAIIRDYIHNGIEETVKNGLFLCTGCEACFNWCPVEVNLAEIMKEIKKKATKKGLAPPPLEDYRQKIFQEKNPFKESKRE
ncbi:MAG: LUD domain-containing protein [Promethearchaeia archaeon]